VQKAVDVVSYCPKTINTTPLLRIYGARIRILHYHISFHAPCQDTTPRTISHPDLSTEYFVLRKESLKLVAPLGFDAPTTYHGVLRSGRYEHVRGSPRRSLGTQSLRSSFSRPHTAAGTPTSGQQTFLSTVLLSIACTQLTAVFASYTRDSTVCNKAKCNEPSQENALNGGVSLAPEARSLS
jgi:hypothetical protein